MCIYGKNTNPIERRLLVISKRQTKKGEEIKYSFTNAPLAQYTKKAIAQMQAQRQRFFIEHNFKGQRSILGMDQFQTRKWLSWHHQVALNMIIGSFIMKEKRLSKDDIPLLSAWDIMDFLVFKSYKEMTGERMLDKIMQRHKKKRQDDINYCYSMQKMC